MCRFGLTRLAPSPGRKSGDARADRGLPAGRRVIRAIAVAVTWSALVGVVGAQDATQPSAATPPSRSEPAVTWGGGVDVVSRYLWRGIPSSQGKVVWPSAWVSGRGITVSLFANVDPNYHPKLNEYDLTVAYERTIGRLTLTGTYIRYAYFEGALSFATTELVGRAAYAVGRGELFTTHAVDVDLYRGSYYLEVGYAIERELDARSTLAADASVAFWSAFIEKHTGVPDSTIGPVSVNVAYTRRLAPHLSVRPHVTFSRIADGEIRKLLDPPAATFGVAAVLAF